MVIAANRHKLILVVGGFESGKSNLLIKAEQSNLTVYALRWSTSMENVLSCSIQSAHF
jgi:hypothetical protein